jgi:hypothetical protein
MILKSLRLKGLFVQILTVERRQLDYYERMMIVNSGEVLYDLMRRFCNLYFSIRRLSLLLNH